jgi:hypothetical protein
MSRLAQRREIYGRESVFITFTVTLTTVSMILNCMIRTVHVILSFSLVVQVAWRENLWSQGTPFSTLCADQ